MLRFRSLQVWQLSYLVTVNMIGLAVAIIAMWVTVRKGMMTMCITWGLARTCSKEKPGLNLKTSWGVHDCPKWYQWSLEKVIKTKMPPQDFTIGSASLIDYRYIVIKITEIHFKNESVYLPKRHSQACWSYTFIWMAAWEKPYVTSQTFWGR